jgi:uncharacterized membrane protein YraQ (UPF0718 family)
MQHEPDSCHSDAHCGPQKGRPDYLLWGSLIVIFFALLIATLMQATTPEGGCEGAHCAETMAGAHPVVQSILSGSHTILELLQKMAWGLILAVLFVGLMDFVPRSKFHQVLGKGGGLGGIARATLAGVLLDLCSHGILLVGMKLFERGASVGQVIAFLVASPWNSLSLTFILWSLIGLPLTLLFIVLSGVIAIASGLIFEKLVSKNALPGNPHENFEPPSTPEPWFQFPKEKTPWQIVMIAARDSLRESRMILRWIFFGIVLTAVVKELISPEAFETYFGPDTLGVLLTLVSATVIEVCSEGAAPLAAELVTTARAPGNGFTFLMTGVSTDYTEIMALRETTRSWKVALFLPLVTVPQVVVIGILLNKVSQL